MDAVSDPAIREVNVMSSAQIGKTEILLNIAGYYIHQDPSPILLLEPTMDLAQTISKTRFAPMIRDTKVLTDKVSPAKSRDSNNTIHEKLFEGGSLTFAGANSPNSLASRPIRVLLMDEVDRFPLDVKGEGDAVSLAKQRTSNFYNRKIVSVSTPTVKGKSRTEEMYLAGTQGRYNVCCVDCGSLFEPVWGLHVKWDRHADTGEYNTKSARLECPHCGHAHMDGDRFRAISRGQWVHRFPDREKKSFHLSAIVSPWIRLHELVERWLTEKNSPQLLQTFKNTVLGETWEEGSQGVDNIDFMAKREDYDENGLPNLIKLLTCGVDTQDDRLEYTVIGWGLGDESWVVEHNVVHGEPSQRATWNTLKERLQKQYRREDGVPLKVLAAGIDSGGHFTENVYQFSRENKARRWWAFKGGNGRNAEGPIFPKRASRTAKTGSALLYLIGVSTAKQLIYSWLKTEVVGPGYVHFHEELDDEYFDGLTAERTRTKYRNGYPYTVWHLPKHKRNEPLDCFVYALAAKLGLNVNLHRVERLNQKALKKLQHEEDEEIVDIDEEMTTQPKEPDNSINNTKRKKRSPRRSGYLSGIDFRL